LHLSQSSSNSSKGVIQAATASNAGAGLPARASTARFVCWFLGARDAMINIKDFTACGERHELHRLHP
jgi:hypothetical protein